jgi:hypothetical protein
MSLFSRAERPHSIRAKWRFRRTMVCLSTSPTCRAITAGNTTCAVTCSGSQSCPLTLGLFLALLLELIDAVFLPLERRVVGFDDPADRELTRYCRRRQPVQHLAEGP